MIKVKGRSLDLFTLWCGKNIFLLNFCLWKDFFFNKPDTIFLFSVSSVENWHAWRQTVTFTWKLLKTYLGVWSLVSLSDLNVKVTHGYTLLETGSSSGVVSVCCQAVMSLILPAVCVSATKGKSEGSNWEDVRLKGWAGAVGLPTHTNDLHLFCGEPPRSGKSHTGTTLCHLCLGLCKFDKPAQVGGPHYTAAGEFWSKDVQVLQRLVSGFSLLKGLLE